MKETRVYKKRIMVELVRKDHNFLYSKRDNKRKGYQIYFFEETPELLEDLKILENEIHEKV
jgi:hypothetical protein